MIPCVWRTWQHGTDEVREGRGRRQYGKRILKAGCCIGVSDQILRELEGGIEGEEGAGSNKVDAVSVNSIAASDDDIAR